MNRRFFFVFFLILSLNLSLSAQELNCTVTINSEQVQGVSKEIFSTLQQSIQDFVNNRKFTNLTFQDKERIECSMLLVVSSAKDNMIVGEFTIQSRRPVYGTSYTTTLVNMKDNAFCFFYQPGDRIEYQPEVFSSNLSALLAYYCYLLIGHDMDSFSRLGGTPFFQQCENIVTQAQGASLETVEMAGWKAFESNRNRYAIINNLMDEAFRPYREYYYEYHRLGLDIMSDNVVNGRARIAKGLPILKQVNSSRPATYVINTFLDAKNDELVQLFKGATDQEKTAAYDILVSIDPTRQNTYDKIKE